VDQIGSEFLDALDRQDVVRSRVAFDDEVALFDDVAVLQVDVLTLRNEVLASFLILVHRLDRDTALVLVVAAESNRAGDFRDDRRLPWHARPEPLRDAPPTAGDSGGLAG